jgi:hypothetical protein
MRSAFKNSIQVVISIVLTVLFLYLAFRGQDINQIIQSIANVPFIWFVILFAGTVVSHVIRAWRWRYLLDPVKENISLRNVFSVVMIGYLINNVVPRLGELIRPYALGKLEGVSKSATMGTIVLERILDAVAFALILLTVLFVYSKPFTVWFPQIANLEWLFFVGAVVLLAAFIFMIIKAEMFFTMFKGLTRFFPKKIRNQSERIFESFLTGFHAAKRPGNFLMIGVSSILIWLSYIVMLYLPFYIYDFSAQYGLNFGTATILEVASGVAFALPTPSGFGSYHTLTSLTLTQLFNVDPMKALSYAVYTHIVGFIATTVIGIYFFIVDKIHIADVMGKNEENK